MANKINSRCESLKEILYSLKPNDFTDKALLLTTAALTALFGPGVAAGSAIVYIERKFLAKLFQPAPAIAINEPPLIKPVFTDAPPPALFAQSQSPEDEPVIVEPEPESPVTVEPLEIDSPVPVEAAAVDPKWTLVKDEFSDEEPSRPPTPVEPEEKEWDDFSDQAFTAPDISAEEPPQFSEAELQGVPTAKATKIIEGTTHLTGVNLNHASFTIAAGTLHPLLQGSKVKVPFFMVKSKIPQLVDHGIETCLQMHANFPDVTSNIWDYIILKNELAEGKLELLKKIQIELPSQRKDKTLCQALKRAGNEFAGILHTDRAISFVKTKSQRVIVFNGIPKMFHSKPAYMEYNSLESFCAAAARSSLLLGQPCCILSLYTLGKSPDA